MTLLKFMVALLPLAQFVTAQQDLLFRPTGDEWNTIQATTLGQPTTYRPRANLALYTKDSKTADPFGPFDGSFDIYETIRDYHKESQKIYFNWYDDDIEKDPACSKTKDYRNLGCMYKLIALCAPPPWGEIYLDSFVRGCRKVLKYFPDSYQPYATRTLNRVAAIKSLEPKVWENFLRDVVAKNHVDFSNDIAKKLRSKKITFDDTELFFFCMMEYLVSGESAVSNFLLPDFAKNQILSVFATYTQVSSLTTAQLKRYIDYNIKIRTLSKSKKRSLSSSSVALFKRQQTAVGVLPDTQSMLDLCPLDRVFADTGAQTRDLLGGCIAGITTFCYKTKDFTTVKKCRSFYETAFDNSMYKSIGRSCFRWTPGLTRDSCGREMRSFCSSYKSTGAMGPCEFAKYAGGQLLADPNLAP